MANDLVPVAQNDVVLAALPSLFDRVRPAWRSRRLIERVQRLLPVDPSSACQKMFNAALRDLRDKIVVAGLDIAREAAKQHKLPPVESGETVERYSRSNVIDLAYRMGLVSRAEWRRLCRVYDIRGDLEHEDDEYEAGPEDCFYVFSTCVDVVLSRDPIQVLRVRDVKDIIEQAGPVTADQGLLDDFKHAPPTRQEEIAKFLIGTALDTGKPDIVRQNGLGLIRCVGPLTQNAVKVQVSSLYQERIGRRPIDLLHALVLHAAGVFIYMKEAQRRGFFAARLEELRKIGTGWRAYDRHGEALRNLREVGGLTLCPTPVRAQLVEWMVLTYIGEPGGYGFYGRNRKVFYSNSAAPMIEDLIAGASSVIGEDLRACEMSQAVKLAARDKDVAERFQELLKMLIDR